MADERKRKGRRGRFRTAADAQDQLLDIRAAQRAVRQGKLKGSIDNTDKSEQRMSNGLGRVRNLDDAIEDFD